jgi:hypothetical protein
MPETNRLSAPVREAMTIVRSLARLYDNNNACKVALRAYEKAATERDEVELEKWRSVLSGLMELVQPDGSARAHQLGTIKFPPLSSLSDEII